MQKNKLVFMKNHSTILIVFCLLILAGSCLDTPSKKNETIDAKLKTVRVNNDYSIDIADFMKESNQLNDEASLQYQNIFKEVYIIVIDESREEFKTVFQDLGEYNDSLSMVENYKNIQLGFLKEAVIINSKEDVESQVINGLPVEIVNIDATTEGIDIAYKIAYIDGSENVYMIMAWTEQDKKETYDSLFEKMIKSFKVNSNSKGLKKNN